MWRPTGRAAMARKSGRGGKDSTLLIDATLKHPAPPLALPAREFMERARVIWDELHLPTLSPRPPWHGYSLGDWPTPGTSSRVAPWPAKEKERPGDFRAPPRRGDPGDAGARGGG